MHSLDGSEVKRTVTQHINVVCQLKLFYAKKMNFWNVVLQVVIGIVIIMERYNIEIGDVLKWKILGTSSIHHKENLLRWKAILITHVLINVHSSHLCKCINLRHKTTSHSQNCAAEWIVLLRDTYQIWRSLFRKDSIWL